MSKKWMKGLSLVLAVVMVMGMLPITAYAAVDSTGRPKDVNNSLVLSMIPRPRRLCSSRLWTMRKHYT